MCLFVKFFVTFLTRNSAVNVLPSEGGILDVSQEFLPILIPFSFNFTWFGRPSMFSFSKLEFVGLLNLTVPSHE